jgi:hypothetical protein
MSKLDDNINIPLEVLKCLVQITFMRFRNSKEDKADRN